MHKKNFVAAIKVGGKVLRESSDRVQLPFGSEYSVLLKNLDTVRMQAQISIDGQDATGWLVIDPGAYVDVERFYRQNRDRGNRFKFIERTDRIEEHRGVGAEDGLVRVEFRREKVYESPKVVEHHTYYHHTYPYLYPRTWSYYNSNFCETVNTSRGSGEGAFVSQYNSLGTIRPTGLSGSASSSASSKPIASMSYSGPTVVAAMAALQNDAGITVNGSISDQRFIPVAGFECEPSEVIVLHLVGRKGTAPISVARTVEHRPTCETCGQKNLPMAKFCIECGTSLEKV